MIGNIIGRWPRWSRQRNHIKAYTSLHQWRRRGNPAAWLSRVVVDPSDFAECVVWDGEFGSELFVNGHQVIDNRVAS